MIVNLILILIILHFLEVIVLIKEKYLLVHIKIISKNNSDFRIPYFIHYSFLLINTWKIIEI